ncbi:gamma-interferon-inducible lysosomal thiol reductase-like protein [Arctopsyche grandis]|uniref:gamma-interferon-inducible lysosomal thiol reductase-like protein n=1 Tax=Arctopsyche grandis TaxID=121162 RepID=UPI00406D96CD
MSAMGVLTSMRLRLLAVLLLLIVVFHTCKLYSDRFFTDKEGEVQGFPRKLVEVAVYYEALCPDSRHFFVHHLEHTHPKLKDDLFLNLIPYGKAKTFTNSDGGFDFECQHGEMECYANKIHACAIEAISDLSEQLSLVTCMIKDNLDPEGALTRCASKELQPTILTCAKGTQGAILLKKHGEFTELIKPTFIPTVFVDGLKGDQAALLKNFLSEVCKYYPSGKKPSGCS